jgi:hypothetical protein
MFGLFESDKTDTSDPAKPADNSDSALSTTEQNDALEIEPCAEGKRCSKGRRCDKKTRTCIPKKKRVNPGRPSQPLVNKKNTRHTRTAPRKSKKRAKKCECVHKIIIERAPTRKIRRKRRKPADIPTDKSPNTDKPMTATGIFSRIMPVPVKESSRGDAMNVASKGDDDAKIADNETPKTVDTPSITPPKNQASTMSSPAPASQTKEPGPSAFDSLMSYVSRPAAK